MVLCGVESRISSDVLIVGDAAETAHSFLYCLVQKAKENIQFSSPPWSSKHLDSSHFPQLNTQPYLRRPQFKAAFQRLRTGPSVPVFISIYAGRLDAPSMADWPRVSFFVASVGTRCDCECPNLLSS